MRRRLCFSCLGINSVTNFFLIRELHDFCKDLTSSGNSEALFASLKFTYDDRWRKSTIHVTLNLFSAVKFDFYELMSLSTFQFCTQTLVSERTFEAMHIIKGVDNLYTLWKILNRRIKNNVPKICKMNLQNHPWHIRHLHILILSILWIYKTVMMMKGKKQGYN